MHIFFLILHEFRFFVNVFLRKIVKTVKFTRKVDKNFKTGVIFANSEAGFTGL